MAVELRQSLKLYQLCRYFISSSETIKKGAKSNMSDCYACPISGNTSTGWCLKHVETLPNIPYFAVIPRNSWIFVVKENIHPPSTPSFHPAPHDVEDQLPMAAHLSPHQPKNTSTRPPPSSTSSTPAPHQPRAQVLKGFGEGRRAHRLGAPEDLRLLDRRRVHRWPLRPCIVFLDGKGSKYEKGTPKVNQIGKLMKLKVQYQYQYRTVAILTACTRYIHAYFGFIPALLVHHPPHACHPSTFLRGVRTVKPTVPQPKAQQSKN